MKNIASITIWNKIVYIGAVLNFMDAIANQFPEIEFGRYNKLRYIVGSMLESRIKNAYPGKEGMLEVEFNLLGTVFEVSIKDKGVPELVDFSHSENVDIHDKIDLRNYVLNQWTDGIGMEQLGKGGQRRYVRMKILNTLQFKAPEPYPEIEVLDTNISIRPVQTEEDAIEAMRCIYSEYGYSYTADRLYYVERLLEMIHNKELMSFLAVNDHGQVAGHFALVFSETFKNMPEISTAVVRREFRGLGLLGRFTDYAIEIAQKLGLRAVMGQPVAFHPMSQKSVLKKGFTASAVMFSYINSDIESEYNKESHRLDVFSSVKILDHSAHSKIYPPASLRSFVQKVYDKLDWTYELCEESETRETTKVHIENNSSMGITKILLHQSADDLEKILEEIINVAIRSKHEMIELLISLRDASCTYGYEVAKKCKFMLSGVIPGAENDDYLIMQMIIGEKPHYERLVTVGEFEELMNDMMVLNGYGKDEKTI